MTAPFKGRVQKNIQDFQGQARPDNSPAQGQDIGIVMRPGHFG
jgi:hypothetical protein